MSISRTPNSSVTMHLDAKKLFDWSFLLWGAIGVLLVANVPLFMCQHITGDAVMFDLQARCALDGGVLYRDILEPNLPGVVWIHMLVRSFAGWSTYALRGFDLLMLSGIVIGLTCWTQTTSERLLSVRRGAITLSIVWFYFSLTEWSHAQRDLWALLPCVVALHLRYRQLKRVPNASVSSLIAWSLLEGIVWGMAFWIKPHIAIPAISIMVTGLLISSFSKRTFIDWISVIAGGAFVGGIGSLWLISTGAWEPLWEMLLVWNPEYLERARERMSSDMLWYRWYSLAPWSWAHALALVTAVYAYGKHWNKSKSSFNETTVNETTINETVQKRLLLSAMYLGWMTQVLLLQFPFAYVHIPGVVLAIALVGTWQFKIEWQRFAWMSFATACAIALINSPATNLSRLSHWSECISQGSTPEVRAALQLETKLSWAEMQPVIDYLKLQQVQDEEVTAYTDGLIHLYPRLGIRPSTKYVFLDVVARVFRSRTEEIHQALNESKQKYVVSSLYEAGMSRESIADAQDPKTLLPKCFPKEELNRFPFTQPVVFRSGPYLVHKVTKPLGPLCTDYLPLERK